VTHVVTLIPGDGIGPEITEAVVTVLTRAEAPIAWDRQIGGVAALEEVGDPLPDATLESIRKNRVVLKGPLTTPVGTGFRSVNVALRREFDLYANVRPARTVVPGGRYEDVDIVLVRENTEGLYIGFETFIPIGGDPKAVAQSMAIVTRRGCERIARFAFMKLVMDPSRFDVIVTTNMFGDILSDEIAGLVGGLGMTPGANIGERGALFEAVHGSAPDIAGQGIANPTALLFAACMMLAHLGEHALADRVRAAVEATIRDDGVRTRDLEGHATTREFTDAVVRRLD
jgi:isocitrate dehydrogenase (NAD+)